MTDLFEQLGTLPAEVQRIIEKFGDTNDYSECEKLRSELKKHGYTCEYGLDGVPYNLAPIEPLRKRVYQICDQLLADGLTVATLSVGQVILRSMYSDGESLQGTDYKVLNRYLEQYKAELK